MRFRLIIVSALAAYFAVAAIGGSTIAAVAALACAFIAGFDIASRRQGHLEKLVELAKADLEIAKAAAAQIGALTIELNGRLQERVDAQIARADVIAAINLQMIEALTQGIARDSERLDWLDAQVHTYRFEDMHEGNRWTIEGPYRDVRAAIDAERGVERSNE